MSISSSRGHRGLPRGPHTLTPEEVARSQRERLLLAMTEVVAEHGYTATPVSKVIERAGVSRKTFYVHFRDRRDCLSAAYEDGVERMLARARSAGGDGADESRLTALAAALGEAALESPGGLRLQVAEIAAAGQAGLLAREQAILTLGGLLRECLNPTASAPPAPVMGMIAGGLLRVLDQRARRGEANGMQPLARELTRWVRSYHPAPTATLAEVDVLPFFGSEALRSARPPIGGRAPGTLSLAPRRAIETGNRVSRSFTAHSQRERILDAVASLSAANGYVALTVDDIVAVAGVSLNTFYEHFSDKEDAFLVAQELGHLRGTAILEHALSRTRSWETGVREGIAALLGFFFSEPCFARLAAVEGPIATPTTAERAQYHLACYVKLLLEGAPRSRRHPAIAEQAIAAALHEAVFAFAVHSAIRSPSRAHSYATYIVLAPFLGASKALASAEDGPSPSARQR